MLHCPLLAAVLYSLLLFLGPAFLLLGVPHQSPMHPYSTLSTPKPHGLPRVSIVISECSEDFGPQGGIRQKQLTVVIPNT